jgi:hypothetical protein
MQEPADGRTSIADSSAPVECGWRAVDVARETLVGPAAFLECGSGESTIVLNSIECGSLDESIGRKSPECGCGGETIAIPDLNCGCADESID